MSAGSPCGAPLSAQRAMVAISSLLSDQSSLNFWIPMFRSMYQGGMTPGLSRSPVRYLMARAQGLTSSYEMSDMGASACGRWHFWQLRCRIGAMSLLNVGSSGAAWAAATCGAAATTSAARPKRPASFEIVDMGILTLDSWSSASVPSQLV